MELKPGDIIEIVSEVQERHLQDNTWPVPPKGTKWTLLEIHPHWNKVDYYYRINYPSNGTDYGFVAIQNIKREPKYKRNLPGWF